MDNKELALKVSELYKDSMFDVVIVRNHDDETVKSKVLVLHLNKNAYVKEIAEFMSSVRIKSRSLGIGFYDFKETKHKILDKIEVNEG